MGWLRTGLIGLGVLVALGFLALTAFGDTIAARAFARAVDKTVGVDRAGELPDGLHLYFCGTGSPMSDADRAGPCLGVLAGDTALVFDAGSGSIRKLGRMGFSWGRLDKAFLTHLHSDHIDGLGELFLQAWIAGGRDAPLAVTGPVGTSTVVDAFNAAYEIDSRYRIAHHGREVARPGGFGGAADEIEAPIGPGGARVVYEQGGVRVTAIPVDHAPVEPAFGYRIDYGGRSVSISGDTVYHEAFVAASQGVDVMVHEALDPEMTSMIGAALGKRGNADAARIFADILDYHATPEDAARAAQGADADTLVYTHIVPPLRSRRLNAMFLGDAPDLFRGAIIVAEDGLMLSLPANTDEVIGSNLLR